MQYKTVTDEWLWRGLNRNGDELGRLMLCIRTCKSDASLDGLNELLNETLDERAELSAEMWRREQEGK